MRSSRDAENMSAEQIKGTRFEIWLEELLRDHGYHPTRNVEFHKKRMGCRQIDILYKLESNGSLHYAMIEAKYSSNGAVKNNLRSPKPPKKGQLFAPLDTILKNLEESRQYIQRYFIPIEYVFLVTNQEFDDEIKILAPKQGVRVVEKPKLQVMHKQRGSRGSIDDSIAAVDCSKYILWPVNFYAA